MNRFQARLELATLNRAPGQTSTRLHGADQVARWADILTDAGYALDFDPHTNETKYLTPNGAIKAVSYDGKMIVVYRKAER